MAAAIFNAANKYIEAKYIYSEALPVSYIMAGKEWMDGGPQI